MTKLTVIGIRPETPAEAAQREWFEKQSLAAPDNLEAAARLLIGLATSLLGVLFGIFSLTEPALSARLNFAPFRLLSTATVVFLLSGLLAALDVVLPWREAAASGMPVTQQIVLRRLLKRKSIALSVAVIAFGLGIVMLGAALTVFLWKAS